MTATAAQIEDWLEAVKDPEIPVISIKELGVLQSVDVKGENVTVNIIPTYSGCPAMYAIKEDIVSALAAHQITDPEIKIHNAPAWTTDMISESGREKMHAYGIAPPVARGHAVACPLCQSKKTEVISQFGSTACKALYRCLDCAEPFDHFKCHAPIL